MRQGKAIHAQRFCERATDAGLVCAGEAVSVCRSSSATFKSAIVW
jgi:hypothetical protein